MNPSTWQLIAQASGVVKLTLGLLGSFSVFSWGLIAYKYLALRRASRQSAVFLQAFESGRPAASLRDLARSLPASPTARIFQAAAEAREDGAALQRLVAVTAAREVERLHAYLTFLATTGSTTPFIGLLGTVWGIMDAFRGIGATGSASLAVVSPAIAEALITTAAGLLAAIPAVIAYNAFLSWGRKLTREVDAFTESLLASEKEESWHADRLAARARV